jgi:hypothetical protein
VPRDLLLNKLSLVQGVRGPILRLLRAILLYNTIRVFDGLLMGDPMLQTQGVL